MRNDGRPFIRATNDSEREIKRKRLMDAGLHSFVEKGYEKTTIAGITTAAGESAGTFYLYFESKLQLYRTLYLEALKLFYLKMKARLNAQDFTATAGLRALAEVYYRFYHDHRSYYLIVSSQHLGQSDFMRDDTMKGVLDEKALELLRLVEKIIIGGVNREEIRTKDPWKTTLTLWGLMDGIILMNERRNLALSETDLWALIEHAVEICLNGLTV